MPGSQQFTFIDVTARKDTNKRRIKSHVANDTNRRKRQAAVALYQNAVLQLTVTSDSSTSSTPNASESSPDTCRSSGTPPAASIIVNISKGNAATDQLHQERTVQSSLSIAANNSWAIFKARLTRRPTWSPKYQVLQPGCLPYFDPVRNLRYVPVKPSALSEPVLPIINLCAPDEFKKTEQALTQIKSFLRGRFQSTWSQNLSQNPYQYEHDYEVGIWRECLSIGFGFFRNGKPSQGFAVIDTVLEATTNLMKKQHPNLIFALLELVMDVHNHSNDHQLAGVLKTHVANLAGTLLGFHHPLTALLKYVTPSGPGRNECIATIFCQVIDIDSEIFGPEHFHTLGLHFALIQFDVASGRLDRAQARFNIISAAWRRQFPVDSLPSCMLEVEEEKIQLVKSLRKVSPEASPAIKKVIASLEELSEYMRAASMGGSVQDTSATPSASASTSSSRRVRKLGEYLVANSYHAMALYTYTHIDTVSFESPGHFLKEEVDHPFAAVVVKILLDNLSEHEQIRNK